MRKNIKYKNKITRLDEDSIIPIQPAEVLSSEAGTANCTANCPCELFARYTDPFVANYERTNCAGLAARRRDQWGNLRESDVFPGVAFSVEGMRNTARRAGKILESNVTPRSVIIEKKCDIFFALWILSPGQWGTILKSSRGASVSENVNNGEDFHIVSGRIDNLGNMPATVYSTNGRRPLELPRSVEEWAFRDGDAVLSNDSYNRPLFYASSSLISSSSSLSSDTLAESLLPYSSDTLPSDAMISVNSGALPLESIPQRNLERLFFYSIHIKIISLPTEYFIIDEDFMKNYV